MIKRVVAGSSGLSILGTAIYFLTRHISEVQYNNWGNGVWNNLLTIQGSGNCSDSSATKNNEYYKACIKQDISTYYDLEGLWNDNNYWKNWYEGKLTNVDDKEKFQKLGSWEKLRELCTKGIDELIKQSDWEQLSRAVGTTSSSTSNPIGNSNIVYEHCWREKSSTIKTK